MFKFWQVQQVMRFPDEGPDVVDPEIAILDKGTEDTEEEEQEESEDKPEDTEESEEDTEESEEESEEEEEKPEDKEEDDGEALARVPYNELKEALKENPELLKKLKTQFFREQKFTELFPTIEVAQKAAQAQDNFEFLRDMVLEGNAEDMLSQVKQTSDKSLKNFASNFLPSLAKVDNDIYVEVTTPIIQDVLFKIAEYGKGKGGKEGDNILNAAKVAHFTVFGNYNLGKPVEHKVEKDPDLERDKKDFYQARYTELASSIHGDIDSKLDSEIEQGLDPTNSLKPGLKRLLIKEIKTELFKQLDSDTEHMGRMQSLWRREEKAGFKGEYKDSIKTTFLSRAKTLIPKIRASKRSEIFAGQKKADVSKKDKLDKRDKAIPVGRTLKSGTKQVTVAQARKAGMTDMDLLS
jgi:hypothetical protein